MDSVRFRGIVKNIYKGDHFEVRLDDIPEEWVVMCTLSGRVRLSRIKICVHDSVDIEISPYDLRKGRIVWRHNLP